MNKVILYGSEYGSCKKYAEKLSQMLNIHACSYDKIASLKNFDTVIYLGAIYAGDIKGLKKTVSKLKENVRLLVITVGLADPEDLLYIRRIREKIQKQLPPIQSERTRFYHLRGEMDYQSLSAIHKSMVTMVYKQVKNLPMEEQTADARALASAFQEKVDYMDYQRLQEVADAIESYIKK